MKKDYIIKKFFEFTSPLVFIFKDTAFTLKFLFFLQRIENGFQFRNPQSDSLQIPVFLEKACYLKKNINFGCFQLMPSAIAIQC